MVIVTVAVYLAFDSYQMLCYNYAMKRTIAKYYYGIQKRGAKKRNVPFNLTFEEWDNWWLSHGVDRNVPRTFVKDSLCMCRKGDVGPYELGNIYCATLEQNGKDKIANNIFPPHTKRISTPDGIFNSVSEAARFYKKDRATIIHRLYNWPGYHYL